MKKVQGILFGVFVIFPIMTLAFIICGIMSLFPINSTVKEMFESKNEEDRHLAWIFMKKRYKSRRLAITRMCAYEMWRSYFCKKEIEIIYNYDTEKEGSIFKRWKYD